MTKGPLLQCEFILRSWKELTLQALSQIRRLSAIGSKFLKTSKVSSFPGTKSFVFIEVDPTHSTLHELIEMKLWMRSRDTWVLWLSLTVIKKPSHKIHQFTEFLKIDSSTRCQYHHYTLQNAEKLWICFRKTNFSKLFLTFDVGVSETSIS